MVSWRVCYSRHVYDNCQACVFTRVWAGAKPQPRPEQQMAGLPGKRENIGVHWRESDLLQDPSGPNVLYF